ncbi:rhythmically expressed gene 2 protein [Teleopsis dalmanni]|uniref:rhythmically expressed gene 2 protein n=1 Tax=Teleopsis dalmanni TaxID=139649 RepID=UPI0018CD5F2E|nr:rhythmically expressed gene 2 protein [Teleopsis dalmanni]
MISSLARMRLITFDVTNTLLVYRSSRVKQYGELGALFGVLCDDNDLARNFKSNWQRLNKTYPNFGRKSNIEYQQWWRLLVQDTFADSGAKIPAEKLEDFTEHLVELYKTSMCWQHCNHSIELLKELRKQQQLAVAESRKPPVLGVIANFDPRLDTVLTNMKIKEYFDFTLNSYDCEVEKPNREIFEMAIERSKLNELKPDECLHIGDGPTTDYLAAKALGWHSALIHERNADYLIKKYGDNIDKNFVFASLYDFHKKLIHNMISW